MASSDAYKELFDQLDSDKDGQITFVEFQKYLAKNGIDKDEPFMKEVFISLDENKDGKLTIDEVKKGVTKLVSDIE